MIDGTKIIKKLLKARGETQQKLADKMGIARSDVARRIGRYEMRIRADLVYMADLLDYDLHIIAIDRRTGQQCAVED